MRVLIVDDDIPTTQVIASAVDWDSFDIDDVSIAYNIQDAEQKMEGLFQDIVICDIEMPKGSGLDLIQWARENGFTSQFVFLTCHAEFNYAATALEHAACAYIIKPFDLYKICAALQKAVDAVHAEQKAVKAEQYGQYWIESRTTAEGNFWRSLLLGDLPSNRSVILTEIEKQHLELAIESRWRPVLMTISKTRLDEISWDENTFQYAIRNVMAELFLGQFNVPRIFTYIHNVNYCALLMAGSELSEMQLQRGCDNLLAALSQYFGGQGNCYIGRLLPLWNLSAERKRLEEVDRNNVAYTGKVLYGGQPMDSNEVDTLLLDANMVRKHLNEMRGADLINTLKQFLESLKEEGKLDHNLLQSILRDFTQAVYSVLIEHNIQAHKLFADNTAEKLSEAAEYSLFEAMRWVSYLTETTLVHLKEATESESIVEKIKRYITENFAQKLSRDEIAANIYLTPNYVSKLFRAQTGEYLNDYINEVRLQKAKELLNTTDKTVSDISSEVGYDNFSYFSTLFKKSSGVSPSQYRKQI